MNVAPVNNAQFGAVNVKTTQGIVSRATKANLNELSEIFEGDIFISSVSGKIAKSYPRHHVINVMATKQFAPQRMLTESRTILIPKKNGEDMVSAQLTENAYDLTKRVSDRAHNVK